MVKQSVLANSSFRSALKSASAIKPKGESGKRNLAADLLLTALIDAFSILVIFLLMNFSSTGDILHIGKGMELPKAVESAQLERTPVIKIENNRIFVDDKPVAGNEQLVQSLLSLRKSFQDQNPGAEFPGAITVQADRRLKYEILNNVVLATSHAGFSDIKFAVIQR